MIRIPFTGTIHLGTSFVIGRRREPKPAAKITAFILIMLYIESVSETWVTKQLLPDYRQFAQ